MNMPTQRVLPQSPSILTGGSFELPDSGEVRICQIQMSEPAPVVAYALIDQTKNGSAFFFQEASSSKVLVVLGHARIGCRGTSFDFLFDIPASGVVQIPVVCESLEISARYAYVATDYVVIVGLGPPDLNAWLVPTKIAGRPVSPAIVTGFVGQGVSGTGTAIRRAQVKFTQAPLFVEVNVPVPNMATHFRVIGRPGTTVYSVESAQTGTTRIGPFAVSSTPSQDWVPLPNPTRYLRLDNPFVAPGDVQVVEADFKIGFDGVA